MPMRKIRKPRYLGAGVTAIALASAMAVALLPGAAAAQVTPAHYNYRVSVTVRDSIFGPCTNESIEMNINFSVNVTGFVQPSGQSKYTEHIVTTGEGEGS
jgi:hypothetical protein